MRRISHVVMLAAPACGLVTGTQCRDRTMAATLLSDRVANGEAFPGEFVVRVPLRVFPSWIAGAYRAEYYFRFNR